MRDLILNLKKLLTDYGVFGDEETHRINKLIIIGSTAVIFVASIVLLMLPTKLTSEEKEKMTVLYEKMDLIGNRFLEQLGTQEAWLPDQQRKAILETMKSDLPSDLPQSKRKEILESGSLVGVFKFVLLNDRMACSLRSTPKKCEASYLRLLYNTAAIKLCQSTQRVGECKQFAQSCMADKAAPTGFSLRPIVASKNCTQIAEST